jgi:hypothetical protein
MINLIKTVMFLSTVAVLSPVVLLAFLGGLIAAGVRVGLKCADDFLSWLTR